MQALRYDPRVGSVQRTQSGLFREGDRFIRIGTPGHLDLVVYLKSGKYVAIEVKAPGRKPDVRQATRIAQIIAQGGLAGWADSVEGAMALLP